MSFFVLTQHCVNPSLGRIRYKNLKPLKKKLHNPNPSLIMDDPTSLSSLERTSQAISSPIQRLFPELLSEIFRHCLVPGVPMRPLPADAPMLLTQVCSRWHTVATSDAMLWRSLRVYVHSKSRSHLELVRVWLRRSGGTPLNVSFSALTDSDALPLFELLCSYAHRWQTLDLGIPLALLRYLSSIGGNFPMLQSLAIQIDGVDDIPIETMTLFRSAASLNILNVDWGIFTLLGGLPSTQLTHLSGKCYSFQDLSAIARSCTGLVEWYVNLDSDSGTLTSLPVFPPHILPQLRSLKLYLPNSVNYGLIFDLLTLPSLEQLQVEDPYFVCPPWPLEQFSALVERSQCSIQWLNLSRVAIDDQKFLSTLELTPMLEELRLQERKFGPWPNLTDETLERLINKPGSPCLIPHLKVLVIERRFTMDLALLIRMLESRWSSERNQPPRNLKTVHFVTAGRKDKYRKALQCLGKLQAQGLEVVVPPKWKCELEQSV